MQLARDELLEKSRIYQKGNAGTLTNYQQHMNNAAYELCLENPSLVNNKGRLMDLARAKVDEEGYPYKKKRSRSKAFGAVKDQGKRKHIKLSAEFRKKRIEDLSEDINSINSTMALLEKERYKQHNMNKYAQAANVEEQIASKRKEKRALEEELTKLQEKETRSKRITWAGRVRTRKRLKAKLGMFKQKVVSSSVCLKVGSIQFNARTVTRKPRIASNPVIKMALQRTVVLRKKT